VHPTLAGVVLGLLTPMTSAREGEPPPAVRLACTLHPWVAFGIVPLFALVNCGVDLHALTLAEPPARAVFLGVVLGLAVGKPLGIVAVSALLVRSGLGALPSGVSLRGILVAGCVAGIGFTMAILVAELSFPTGTLLTAAKVGVLASSLVSGGLGVGLGRLLLRRDGAGDAGAA
jgi:NhaA family Na+:H+ antiporter